MLASCIRGFSTHVKHIDSICNFFQRCVLEKPTLQRFSPQCLSVFVFDSVYVSHPTLQEGTGVWCCGDSTPPISSPHHPPLPPPPPTPREEGEGQQKKFLRFLATDTVALPHVHTLSLSHSLAPTTGEESVESDFIVKLRASSKASDGFSRRVCACAH